MPDDARSRGQSFLYVVHGIIVSMTSTTSYDGALRNIFLFYSHHPFVSARHPPPSNPVSQPASQPASVGSLIHQAGRQQLECTNPQIIHWCMWLFSCFCLCILMPTHRTELHPCCSASPRPLLSSNVPTPSSRTAHTALLSCLPSRPPGLLICQSW